MKIIVEKETELVKFLLDDLVEIHPTPDHIMLNRDGKDILKIACHNEDDCQVYRNVENAPDDYMGNKYTYEDGEFTLVDGWTDPLNEEQQIANQ